MQSSRKHFPYFCPLERIVSRRRSCGCTRFSSCFTKTIDCNNTQSCRVGSGPAEPGVNAPRKPNTIHSAFYNGWLHQSGFKHQSVELPNGLTMDWWGAMLMRENDIWMANNSEINRKLSAAQHSNAEQFVAFGDSIYVPDTHVRRC